MKLPWVSRLLDHLPMPPPRALWRARRSSVASRISGSAKAIPGVSLLATLLITALMASCGRETSQQKRSRVDATDTVRRIPPSASPSSDVTSRGSAEDVELVEAATRIVRFLRGEALFDSIHLADTVSLYLGLEEGRTRRDVERALLRDRTNWKVQSESLRHSYSFVPPARTAALTTRVGRHLNCLDYPLSASFPDLARLPHVGTMLSYGTASCLQTWTLTVIFDPHVRPPKLVAAVYDQFEW